MDRIRHSRGVPRAALAFLAILVVLPLGCGKDDQDPEQAKKVWAEINAGRGFRAWERAPNYPDRRPSFTAHASAVEIFINQDLAATYRAGKAIKAFPTNATVVKEGFSSVQGGSRRLVAVMKKNPDGWFWAEYDDDGEALFSGRPSVCTECHDNRKDYSDWIYSFELPR